MGPLLDTPKTSPAIEDFQEVLRIWPLSRDGEAVSPGVVDVKCPDCGAIFSSLYGPGSTTNVKHSQCSD